MESSNRKLPFDRGRIAAAMRNRRAGVGVHLARRTDLGEAGVIMIVCWRNFPIAPHAIKVGLAYSFQLLDRLPQAGWDRRLNFVVTESAIYPAPDAGLARERCSVSRR